MARNWIVTRDSFLSTTAVQRLYADLKDAKDLALQRGRFYSHVRDHYILKTLLETGARVFELVAIRIRDFKGKSLIIQKGKGNKKREILLMPSTQRMLKEFIKIKIETLDEAATENDFLFTSERKKPYTTRGIRKRVKYWFHRCEVENHLSVHSCRHTYISHLLDQGVDIQTVRTNAGHSSLNTTSLYGHTLKTDLDGVEIYDSSSFNGSRNNFKKRKA
ncbi:MAG: tyrosine-type recombinase/integrase [Bdellovibrionales bacterium]|nr:tyrosine-type recombinase/integrase [Bdellovibrionales bacterium]